MIVVDKKYICVATVIQCCKCYSDSTLQRNEKIFNLFVQKENGGQKIWKFSQEDSFLKNTSCLSPTQ